MLAGWLDIQTLMEWYAKLATDWWWQFKLELYKKAGEMQERILLRQYKNEKRKLKLIFEGLDEIFNLKEKIQYVVM